MKQATINQCDFCEKVSFHKSTIRNHEKICFHNPSTQSCATCLWFSPLVIDPGYPVHCYKGKLEEPVDDSRMALKTNCRCWMNFSVYMENETCDNQDVMEENLLSGQEEYFKALLLRGEKDRKQSSYSDKAFASPSQTN